MKRTMFSENSRNLETEPLASLIFRRAGKLVSLCLAPAALFFICPQAAAQDLPLISDEIKSAAKRSTILPTEIPIEISAERVRFNYETETYTASGNVTLSQGNTRIRADTIRYDGRTGILTAEGKVIARTGGDVLEAERISINLGQTKGVLVNGKLFLTKHNIYLEGEKLEKTGDSSYRIHRGSFTTCDGLRPDWRITGRDLDVTLEGYGTLKHGVFYVKDIPVLYVPWIMYPAKRKRQSGFLMPNLSNSSLRGFDLRLPLFVALSRSSDLTLTPRICTKRAYQTALEFRYIPWEDLKGRFYGEHTYDWEYGSGESPRSHRFYFTWHHDQDLIGLATLRANGAWVSDRDYFDVWGGSFDRRRRVRYLESNAILYKQWDNVLFQAEARHFDDLDLPDNAVTVQNLPIVTGTLFNQRIPYTPLYFSSNVMYNHYYAPIMDKQWLGSRFRVNAGLSLPIALGRYLKMEPSFRYFAKAYIADYYEKDKSVKSVRALRTDLYEIKTDLFTDLQSVYNFPILGFQRTKHSIRPRVTWTYRPPGAQITFPRFDETDTIDRASLLTAEIRQSLSGRLGPRQYLDFMTLSISQGYDFLKFNDQEPVRGEDSPLGGWTNTLAELTFRPHTLVDLVAQGEYDLSAKSPRKYGMSLGLMDHRGDLVRVLHQFVGEGESQELNRQTNVSLQVKLGSTLDWFFENQYTHRHDFSYYTGFGLVYHPQCWNIELKYSEAREKDPLTNRIKDPDQVVYMTLSLYGLGQVYRMSREWSDLLGGGPVRSDSGGL